MIVAQNVVMLAKHQMLVLVRVTVTLLNFSTSYAIN